MSPQCYYKGKKNYQTEKKSYVKICRSTQSHNF